LRGLTVQPWCDRSTDCKPALSARTTYKDSFLSELLSEDPILRKEIFDGLLLSAIDPAGEDQEQQMPWLKLGLHVPPDARLGSAASAIVGTPSSVAPGVASVRGKARHYNRLRPG
jgi:hypothetical protein